MRKLLALLALVLFLWPAAAQAVSLCAISGQVFNPDGTTMNNGTVQFNSQVTQVVGSTTIPPSIISTTTDASGNMAPMSVAQGLFGTFTFCQGHGGTNTGGAGGGCAAPINGLIPINTTGNIQSVIAGVLLPSVGNATVNNLTVTSNTMVGGTLQVSGATTLSTLNVTGAATTGALTAPTLNLTLAGCSALTLAQGVIASNPPDADLYLMAGAHCTSGGYIADSNSAVTFGSYTRTGTTGDHNGGWQWTGNTGLTPGSAYTPTLTMALATNAADMAATTTGVLRTNSLILDNSSTTAVQFGGGSVASLAPSNINLAAGTHYNGTSWVANSTIASSLVGSSTGGGGGIQFTADYGLTVGNTYTQTVIGYGFNASSVSAGWWFSGTNPTLIAQSTTNTNSDIIEAVPQNGSQGVGILWSGLHSIGSATAVTMNIDAKGGNPINLNTINVGGAVNASGPVLIQDNYHLGFSNNGTALPTLASPCSAGSLYAQSTDNVGQVTFSAPGATGCAMNFGRAWANYPFCVCSAATVGGTSTACSAIDSGTIGVTFYFGAAMNTNGYVDYVCMGTQ